MECGRLAVERLEGSFDNWLSSEVEPSAIKVVDNNFDDVTHLGDITQWKSWDINWSSIDLILGGSPCQGFSRAGKELNFDDPRSALFFVYVDILNHVKTVNPDVKFMLENVSMKKEWVNIISDHLGVEPVMLDAKYFTAHSRPRLFWFNWELNKELPPQKKLSDVMGFDVIGCSRRARYINGKGGKTFQKLEKRTDALANCMTTVQKNCKFIVDGVERHLTIEEACTLQGVPARYFRGVNKTSAMRMLGNGWNVDVICFVLEPLFK